MSKVHKVKPTTLRSHVVKYMRTMLRSLSFLNTAWGNGVHVGTFRRVGRPLPEVNAERLKDAYFVFLAVELCAAEGRRKFIEMVKEVHGEEVADYVVNRSRLSTPPTITEV